MGDVAMTDGSPAVGLRFEILGPVRAFRDGEPVDLGPVKQQAVLALLLLHAGRPVPIERIVGALWGGDPPENGVDVVQRYVGGLRRALDPERTSLIALTPGGYVLRESAVDAEEFRAALAEARAGDPHAAGGEARRALALWRDEPLAGLTGTVFESARAHLNQERAAAAGLLAPAVPVHAQPASSGVQSAQSEVRLASLGVESASSGMPPAPAHVKPAVPAPTRVMAAPPGTAPAESPPAPAELRPARVESAPSAMPASPAPTRVEFAAPAPTRVEAAPFGSPAPPAPNRGESVPFGPPAPTRAMPAPPAPTRSMPVPPASTRVEFGSSGSGAPSAPTRVESGPFASAAPSVPRRAEPAHAEPTRAMPDPAESVPANPAYPEAVDPWAGHELFPPD
jgi:hypothetical protein